MGFELGVGFANQAVACGEAVALGEDELVLLDVVVVLRVDPLHAAQQVVDDLARLRARVRVRVRVRGLG